MHGRRRPEVEGDLLPGGSVDIDQIGGAAKGSNFCKRPSMADCSETCSAVSSPQARPRVRLVFMATRQEALARMEPSAARSAARAYGARSGAAGRAATWPCRAAMAAALPGGDALKLDHRRGRFAVVQNPPVRVEGKSDMIYLVQNGHTGA